MKRMEEEERISGIEDKIVEKSQAENNSERKILDHQCRLWELSDSIKHSNIHVIGVTEEEEEGENRQKVFLRKL